MKTLQAAVIAVVCTFVTGSGIAFAQLPVGRPALPASPTVRFPVRGTTVPQHVVLPTRAQDNIPASSLSSQQKTASDQAMQNGRSQLQAAERANQTGNRVQAINELQAAVNSMSQAAGIYKGHRSWAMAAATDAYRALQRKDYLRQAGPITNQIAIALRESNNALKTN